MNTATQARIERIPAEEYHARPGTSSGKLRDFLRSPRLYEARYILGTAPRERTSQLDLGNVVHSLLLDSRPMAEVAVQIPGSVLDKAGRRTGKAWAEWSEANADKFQLTDADYAAAVSCYDAVLKHPKAGAILTAPEGLREASAFWLDGETGLECRARFDLWADWHGVLLADLKTTSDASPRAFARSAHEYGYHVQQEFYREGAAAVSGGEHHPFCFIAVQTKPPHVCRVYELDERAAESGSLAVMEGLAGLKRAHESNDFSDPNENEIMSLSLPAWAYYS